MNSRSFSVFAVGCLLLVGAALGADDIWSEVHADGETGISVATQSTAVVVDIKVRKVQRAVSETDAVTMLAKDCLEERAPCSLVEQLRIKVDKNSLFVPRSAFRGLSNVRLAKLTSIRGGFELTLRGGDGSEGYILKIVFDKNRVTSRILASSLAPNDALEVTRYRKQNESFDR